MSDTAQGPARALVSMIARSILTAEQRSAVARRLRAVHQARYRLSPRYRENRRRLAAWRDRYRGETCVVIGNGPSMRGFDLARLAHLRCFALNRGYLMWCEQDREPDFLVAVNDLVLEQFGDEIAGAGRHRFVPWDFARAFGAVAGTCFLETPWRPRFHTDIATGAWPGGTVTFTALQIAYHMGFARVVLIGVDHSFVHDGAPNSELLSRGADPNHFDPGYFGAGTRWHAPDLRLSEVSYTMARRAFEADGREVIDATEGGELRVFPRAGLEQLL